MRLEQAITDLAERVGNILEAETETTDRECLIKKIRIVSIHLHTSSFDCTFEHEISFKNVRADGSATNQADIYLVPEELPIFSEALQQYPVALPTQFGQSIDANPNVLCLRLTAEEPPEHFAERLAAALRAIDKPK